MKMLVSLLMGCSLFAGHGLMGQEVVANQWFGHVNLLLGYKGLESGWSPADDQFAIGFDCDLQPPRWPVNLVLQVIASGTEDLPDASYYWADFTSSFEVNLGVRKAFTQHPVFQPFIGGGLSIISAGTSWTYDYWGSETIESDTGVGWWAGGGLYVNLNPMFHLGVLAQYSWAKVDLFGRDLNAGGVTATFVLGGRW